MKNNILTIILCAGSLVLGSVLNSYWKFGDVLLQTEEAHQEIREAYSANLASCRAIEYGVNNLEVMLYQRALNFYVNPDQDSEKHIIHSLWWRYSDLVNDLNHRHNVLIKRGEESSIDNASTFKILQEANSFVSQNSDLFNKLETELFPNFVR